MKRAVALLLFCLIAVAQDRPVQTITLANGMKVLVQEDHNIPNVAVYLFFKIGSRNEHPGAITISTYTQTATTVQAVDMALDILKRLGEKGFTEEQVVSAKAYIKGTFPTSRLETIDQLASALTDLELYGLNRDEIDGYFARLDGVTLARANAAARKYYQTSDLTIVLLGAADKIREQVRKYGPLTEVSVKAAGFGNE